MPPDTDPGRAIRPLFAGAALMVILAGLKAAGDLVVPFLFALLVSVLVMPLVRRLTSLRVPRGLAIPIVVLAVAATLVIATAVVGSTLGQFTASIPRWERQLESMLRGLGEGRLASILSSFGIESGSQAEINVFALLRPGQAMRVVTQTLNAVVEVAKNLLLVALTITFILFEAGSLRDKVIGAFGRGDTEERLSAAGDKVQRYLVVKTAVSAATGVLAWAWTYALGLDFPILWGLIAFLLNYVPAIGSIIAAVPPTTLALLQLGVPGAIGIAAGFLVINILLGNLLEPRLMGATLGLSPLVVFLSLLFWGWVWGPAGMLLSVPLTVIVKIFLEAGEETRWIGVLLGPGREAAEAAELITTQESLAAVGGDGPPMGEPA